MNLDIDITDKKAREIIAIIQEYPEGHLEIKFERVYWIADSSVPMSRCGPEGTPRNRGAPQPGLAGGFGRALDVLGSMTGPPQANPQRR
jgi:hypothetical protein